MKIKLIFRKTLANHLQKVLTNLASETIMKDWNKIA